MVQPFDEMPSDRPTGYLGINGFEELGIERALGSHGCVTSDESVISIK